MLSHNPPPHDRRVLHRLHPEVARHLQSPVAQGMSTQRLGDHIHGQTGQVTTKAVVGKLNRLRERRMRDELTEDLAKGKSTALRAGGSPFGWAALLPDQRRFPHARELGETLA